MTMQPSMIFTKLWGLWVVIICDIINNVLTEGGGGGGPLRPGGGVPMYPCGGGGGGPNLPGGGGGP